MDIPVGIQSTLNQQSVESMPSVTWVTCINPKLHVVDSWRTVNWNVDWVSIKGRSGVGQVSIKGVDQHMTTAAFSTHYPEKSNPKLTTYTSVARYTGN